MAKGDVFTQFGSVASGATVTIQNMTGNNLIINFSTATGTWTLYISNDGTTFYDFDASNPGFSMRNRFIVKNNEYLKIKNSGTSQRGYLLSGFEI